MNFIKKALDVSSYFMVIKQNCPYCIKAKYLLDNNNIAYKIYVNEKYPELDNQITRETGQKTWPKIYFDNKFIGGCSDLENILNKNKFKIYLLFINLFTLLINYFYMFHKSAVIFQDILSFL